MSLAILAASILYLCFVGFENEFGGYAALVAIPASIGALVTGASDPVSPWPAWKILVIPTACILGMVGLAWLAAAEGAICIAMILPLWVPASIGGAIARALADRHRRKRSEAALHAVGWAVLPAVLLTFEWQHPPQWQVRTVSRSVLVNASRERVWPMLVSITNVRPGEGRSNPTQDILGVPRPTQARLLRQGSRLVRKAEWGPLVRFDEVITDLRPNREIAWHFSFPDDSVQRQTDRHVAPNGGMLNIMRGRYVLEALAPDTTRVTLQTTYRMRTRLPDYFGWWGERMLGDIQANVLAIVAERSRSRLPVDQGGS